MIDNEGFLGQTMTEAQRAAAAAAGAAAARAAAAASQAASARGQAQEAAQAAAVQRASDMAARPAAVPAPASFWQSPAFLWTAAAVGGVVILSLALKPAAPRIYYGRR